MTEIRTIEERREAWLRLAKELALAAHQRMSHLVDTCPLPHERAEARVEALGEVAKLNNRTSELCQAMREIENEKDDEPMGTNALLGQEPSEAIRITVVLFTLRNITDALSHSLNRVGEAIDYAAGREPTASIEVRQAFRSDGVLRPHFHVEPDATIDRYYITLTESAFSTVLGLPQDVETQVLMSLPKWPRGRR